MATRHYEMPQPDNSNYVGLPEAVRLGYGGYQFLRGRIRTGQLPAVKIGGRVKVLRSDLDRLVEPHAAPPFESVKAGAERIAAAAGPLSDDEIQEITGILTGASTRQKVRAGA